jgi:hypothetical protein
MQILVIRSADTVSAILMRQFSNGARQANLAELHHAGPKGI